MTQETLSLEDYLEQLQSMKKMGSMKGIIEMLPGLAGQIDEDKIDEAGLKREEVILRSMTRKERQNHLIIGPSRRARIAKGSGTSVAEINRLLKKFEKTRLMMKKMSKNKKYQQQLMGGNQR